MPITSTARQPSNTHKITLANGGSSGSFRSSFCCCPTSSARTPAAQARRRDGQRVSLAGSRAHQSSSSWVSG